MTAMQPTDCPSCQVVFEADSLLQAEIRHLAVTSGATVARSELNDRLSDIHAEHP